MTKSAFIKNLPEKQFVEIFSLHTVWARGDLPTTLAGTFRSRRLDNEKSFKSPTQASSCLLCRSFEDSTVGTGRLELILIAFLVGVGRLELPTLTGYASETYAYTNSATRPPKKQNHFCHSLQELYTFWISRKKPQKVLRLGPIRMGSH